MRPGTTSRLTSYRIPGVALARRIRDRHADGVGRRAGGLADGNESILHRCLAQPSHSSRSREQSDAGMPRDQHLHRIVEMSERFSGLWLRFSLWLATGDLMTDVPRASEGAVGTLFLRRSGG
jgi:hypothetical protein